METERIIGPTPQEFVKLGQYCEACLRIYAPYVELCEIRGRWRFTLCEPCAWEHDDAQLVQDVERAEKLVWARLRSRLEVLQ